MFDEFCLKQLGGWEKYWSLPTLENAIIDSFEEILGIDEASAKKIVLYHANRPFFTAAIDTWTAFFPAEYMD